MLCCPFNLFSETEHAALAGGKGAMLATLYRRGYPVPDGFLILSAAFDAHGLTENARMEVETCYSRLARAGKVAVRSSAIAEDSLQASYAGEFETVLNIDSREELFRAIHEVFESGHSDRVKLYAEAAHDARPQTMAIVVQSMVAAECAGVLFTADPLTGDTASMHGNLTKGLGDKLVSGETGGEAFVYRADTGAYQGPEHFLPYRESLFALAAKLAAEFEYPLDIEWATYAGQTYLLQCRPITGLFKTPEIWNDSLEHNCLWCNTNLGELFGNVMTPFTWSVFREVVRRNVGPVRGHSMVGRIGGRCYFNISLIYSILAKLGKNRKAILGSFDLFLGYIPDSLEVPAIELAWTDAMRFVFGQTVQSVRSALRLKKFIAWTERECPAWCDSQSQAIARAATRADLIERYAALEPVVFDTFAMVAFVGNAFVQHQYKLKSALAKSLSPEEQEIVLSGLDGEGQLPSLAPLLGIAAMAKGVLTREEFVRRYGHRGPNEAEFAAPRTAEDPNWIDTLFAQWQDADPEALLAKQRDHRAAIWAKLERDRPKEAKTLRDLCASAAELAHRRELAKSENFRQAWVVRNFVRKAAEIVGIPPEDAFYLELEELLAVLRGDRQVLEKIPPRRATYDAYCALPALPNLISGAIDPFRWAKMPNRRPDCYDANALSDRPEGDKVFKGFPGSAGVVEGTVRVLTSHEQMNEFVTGEILVTSFTNVGWTPLFPRAAAIVTDIGAPLSHAAIVARELGIPAVVGAGSATVRLKTGDTVRVNGGLGIVEIL